jgi:hypothetical protein
MDGGWRGCWKIRGANRSGRKMVANRCFWDGKGCVWLRLGRGNCCVLLREVAGGCGGLRELESDDCRVEIARRKGR